MNISRNIMTYKVVIYYNQIVIRAIKAARQIINEFGYNDRGQKSIEM